MNPTDQNQTPADPIAGQPGAQAPVADPMGGTTPVSTPAPTAMPEPVTPVSEPPMAPADSMAAPTGTIGTEDQGSPSGTTTPPPAV